MALGDLRWIILLLIKHRRGDTFIELPFFCIIADIFIKAVMGYRFEPWVSQLGSKTEEKMNSRCEFIFLRSLTPARMIRIKQIMNDAA